MMDCAMPFNVGGNDKEVGVQRGEHDDDLMRTMSRVDMACEGIIIDIGNKHNKCIQVQIAYPNLQE